MYTSTDHKFVIFKLNLKPSESGTWHNLKSLSIISCTSIKELHKRTSRVLIIGNIIYQLSFSRNMLARVFTKTKHSSTILLYLFIFPIDRCMPMPWELKCHDIELQHMIFTQGPNKEQVCSALNIRRQSRLYYGPFS